MPVATLRMPEVRHETIRMAGGWDQLTPPLSLSPGALRDVLNFECVPNMDKDGRLTGGYARIGGYERYDGRKKPSSASYSLIQVTSFTNVPTVGQTLTGATSGATGVIIAVSEANKYMAVTKVTGSFSATEVVKVGTTTIGTATAVTYVVTAKENAQYTNLAADQYRTDIAKVPGSGSIRGVFGAIFGGVDAFYAFRDNAAATQTDLYKATATGWSQVTLFNEVSFTAGGTTAPADGATLTKGAVTATIKRVVLESGSWEAGDAAGRFIVDTPAGGDFSAGAATIGTVTVTLSGAQTAIKFNTGGRFETIFTNFGGQEATFKIYGCDSINRGFEFDGTTLVPIATGTSPDTPKHLAAHKNHLFFAFLSSVIHSGAGKPYKWKTADGASEIATGDTVTGLMVQPGEPHTAAMIITGLITTSLLYGTGVGDWNLVTYRIGVGARHYMVQNIARSYALHTAGVLDLQAAFVFGNFQQATLTYPIQTFIDNELTKSSYATVNRAKSQYRAFFSDGYGLYVTVVNGVYVGSAQVLFPNPVYCAWEGVLISGEAVSFFGSTDGFVYELDKGSSFDGAEIDAYIVTNWIASRSSRARKRYRRASIEMSGNFYAALDFSYLLGYGTNDIAQDGAVTYTSKFSQAGTWDTGSWDALFWDGQTIAPTTVRMVGTGENVQIKIASATDYISPYTIHSITVSLTPRRALRGEA